MLIVVQQHTVIGPDRVYPRSCDLDDREPNDSVPVLILVLDLKPQPRLIRRRLPRPVSRFLAAAVELSLQAQVALPFGLEIGLS